MLGRRTAEMHLALAASALDPAFAPEPLGQAEIASLVKGFEDNAGRALDLLKSSLSTLPDDMVEPVGLVYLWPVGN